MFDEKTKTMFSAVDSFILLNLNVFIFEQIEQIFFKLYGGRKSVSFEQTIHLKLVMPSFILPTLIAGEVGWGKLRFLEKTYQAFRFQSLDYSHLYTLHTERGGGGGYF